MKTIAYSILSYLLTSAPALADWCYAGAWFNENGRGRFIIFSNVYERETCRADIYFAKHVMSISNYRYTGDDGITLRFNSYEEAMDHRAENIVWAKQQLSTKVFVVNWY